MYTTKVSVNRKTRPELFTTSEDLAEIKAFYKTKRKAVKKVTSADIAFEVLRPLYDSDTLSYLEESFMLLLNRAYNVIGWVRLSTGGTVGTVIDSKIVLTLALQTNAHSIIISHNHPSGNPKPSESDKRLTNRLKQAADIMDIALLDHLIITPDDSFYSFNNEGHL